MRWRLTLLVMCAATAGCGGSTRTAPPAPVSSAGTVSTERFAAGTILVDGSGRTLYAFSGDGHGVSRCAGACASAWPPFVVTDAANAGFQVDAAKLGTTTRPDGTKQVVYAGRPLYRFGGDTSAGALAGQGRRAFGGLWYVVSPDGRPLVTAAR